MTFDLAAIARIIGAAGPAGTAPAGAGPATPSGVSIDSRTLQPGDLYFAIRGERHDGHAFVAAALAAGALAAVVEADSTAAAGPQSLVVADSLLALQTLAHATRRAWGGPVIGITGSAGKTTTKDMIAAVLATRYNVLKSAGNLNNHYGVPLTLLRLKPSDEVAVVEMGMNHAGEIARLAAIAEPNIGVFTNVGAAHLGNFASVDAIAAAKRELALAIPPSGTLVLNADDPRVARFAEGFTGRVIWYGAAHAPAVPLQLQFPGIHNLRNAQAAMATASLFAVAPDAAAAALAALTPGVGRGQITTHHGVTVIDDCYNANPAAMEQMLTVLASLPGRRHIAVLGEMLELGPAAAQLHHAVGAFAAALKLDALYAVRGEARHLVTGARAAGFTGPLYFDEDAAAAAVRLRGQLQAGDVVLFKASRGVRLEQAVALVRQDVSPDAEPEA